VSRRTAKPLPCPWCGSEAQTFQELGGVGWRVACKGSHFGPAPCRVLGPIRLNVVTAADDWNQVVGRMHRVDPQDQPTPLPDSVEEPR
jgi:hypothetical protein